MFSQKKSLLYLLFFYCVLWITVAQIIMPNLDGYGDMIEAYAWGQRFFMGSFKHPPLTGWVSHVWFRLFPTTTIFYYVLAYINALIGIVGILILAKLFLQQAAPAIAKSPKETHLFLLLTFSFTVLSGAYSYYAAQYNADTILLSLWPWITLTFFWYYYRCHQISTKLITMILFSLLAAAGMLAKYYTVILLLSLFIISLVDRNMRAHYKTVYPYLAMVLVSLLLLPHFLWEYQMHFPANEYVGHRFTSQSHIMQTCVFILSFIYQFPLAWLVFLFWQRKKPATQSNQTIDKQHTALKLMPLNVWLICVLPVAITSFFGFFLSMYLKLHWAIPVWFALPIFMAFLFINKLHTLKERTIVRFLVKLWVGIIVFALIMAIVYVQISHKTYTMARQQMAYAVAEQFHQRFPQHNLTWVAGTWREPAALAFHLPEHPIALPGYPDQMPALVNPYPNWNKEYGVILCYKRRFIHIEQDDDDCVRNTIAWLSDNNIAVRQQKIYFHPQGFQYKKKLTKAVTVFWVVPAEFMA